MSNTTLLIASSDEHFRETVRENLINLPKAKIVAEYQEVAQTCTSACCRIWSGIRTPA